MSIKDEIARRLAEKHYEIETGVLSIFRLTDSPEAESGEREPIKLLEVCSDTAATGIMPLHFAAAPAAGIPYPSVIVV